MNIFKNSILFLSILMIFSTIFTPLAQANTQDASISDIENLPEEDIDDKINFIKNEAMIIDESGSAKIDLTKIEEKFGYVPDEYIEFNNSAKNIDQCSNATNSSENQMGSASIYNVAPASTHYNRVTECVMNEIQATWKDATGISSITAAAEALAAGKRGEAAKLVIKAGVRGGVHGALLSLAWIEITCNVQEF